MLENIKKNGLEKEIDILKVNGFRNVESMYKKLMKNQMKAENVIKISE